MRWVFPEWHTSILIIVFVSVLSSYTAVTADVVEGVKSCMNNEECVGANRRCFHNKTSLTGTCVCKEGYIPEDENSFSCKKAKGSNQCSSDFDCREGDVCIIVKSERFMMGWSDTVNKKICIGTWVIYAAGLDREPKSGSDLPTQYYPDNIFFKRGRRVPQQYVGFVEDMMLVLFLVCILVTLITVHRASCYRQFQDARRNTPLRHILPIAEDQPPPYSEPQEAVDGLTEVLADPSQPKRVTETPPPSYEEALYRNSVLLPDDTVPNISHEHSIHNLHELSPEESALPTYHETRIRIFENLHQTLPKPAVNTTAAQVEAENTVNDQPEPEQVPEQESEQEPEPEPEQEQENLNREEVTLRIVEEVLDVPLTSKKLDQIDQADVGLLRDVIHV